MGTVTAILNFISALTALISSCLICPGAFIAALAVFFASRSVAETRRNTQAQIASTMLDAYATDYMLEDTAALRQWKIDHPVTSAEDFVTLREAGDKTAGRVDRARRNMAHYFQKAAILADHNLIDHKLLKDIISENQVRFATEFVEPLDVELTRQITKAPDPHWAYRKLRTLHLLPWVDETIPPKIEKPTQ
jgi:hypothetical protein